MEVLRGPSFLSFVSIWLFVAAIAVHCSTREASVNSTTATSITNVWSSRGSEHKWYDIYYDVVTRKKVPMVQRFGDRQDEPNTARFGSIPCSCQNLTCGCCAQFNVRVFNYNKRGCMNFTYDPSEFAVKGNMFMDDESRYEYTISAKNPPPACMQVPVPYVPSMDVCLKMFDVHTVGRNLHACVNFLTRVEHAEVLVLEFDCFVVGRDGVSVEKYGTTSSAAATTAQPEQLRDVTIPEATDADHKSDGNLDGGDRQLPPGDRPSSSNADTA